MNTFARQTKPGVAHPSWRRPSTFSARKSARASKDDSLVPEQGTVQLETTEGHAFATKDTVVSSTGASSATVDVMGESTYGNLHVLKRLRSDGVVNVLGLDNLDDILTKPTAQIEGTVLDGIKELGAQPQYPNNASNRAVFCNRTLNLRSIRVVGFDLDYTLIQYDVQAWEGKAYEYGLRVLAEAGVPVEGLKFDPEMVLRGLVIDIDKGNMVKIDRFGLVKRAMHGLRLFSALEVLQNYGRELVHLSNARWVFTNTLFSVSEGCLYMQMVDLMDRGEIPAHLRILTYRDLWATVQNAMYQAHVESRLKQEILEEPERYVELDPDLAATLLDLKEAGKSLLLITNSDWRYTDTMMSYVYDRYLPERMKWRDLFDMVIVHARKPHFWADGSILMDIVSDDGLLRMCKTAVKGGRYCGGSASIVERALGLSGSHFLYVGDHIYTDAALAKLNFKWRTALIIRELEDEIDALARGRPQRRRLRALLRKKEVVGDLFNQLRLRHTRHTVGRDAGSGHFDNADDVRDDLAQLLMVMDRLDQAIVPLIASDGSEFNERWGYLSIAGVSDASQLTRQIAKYADVYTSRVANLLRYTPYAYFRSQGQPLVHDPTLTGFDQSSSVDRSREGSGD